MNSTIFKAIVEDVREIIAWAKSMYLLWRKSLRMKLAISLADMKQKAFNKRYFIMTMQIGNTEKLVSVTRDDVVRLKRKKWLPKEFTHIELEQECFYMTDLSRNNTLSKEAREKALKKYRKYIKKWK